MSYMVGGVQYIALMGGSGGGGFLGIGGTPPRLYVYRLDGDASPP